MCAGARVVVERDLSPAAVVDVVVERQVARVEHAALDTTGTGRPRPRVRISFGSSIPLDQVHLLAPEEPRVGYRERGRPGTAWQLLRQGWLTVGNDGGSTIQESPWR